MEFLTKSKSDYLTIPGVDPGVGAEGAHPF